MALSGGGSRRRCRWAPASRSRLPGTACHRARAQEGTRPCFDSCLHLSRRDIGASSTCTTVTAGRSSSTKGLSGRGGPLKAEIRDASEGLEDAHAIFATSWETAYPVLTSSALGARFYLVQDLEPLFYPAGSEALLAEATYRFGFHGVTPGRWLAQRLEREYGMAADYFDFGCDPDRYWLDQAAERTGVCLYSRPSTPRRAFALAVAALDLFAERHPEIDIHLYGESVRGLPFAATDHGLLTPEELNCLYNRCVAGLALSATNISLVPYEMLAAGCIPVVNDAEQNRSVLDNPQVAYAPATPFDLANALAALVEKPAAERRAAAEAATASVQGMLWEDAGAVVERVVREVVEAACREPYAPTSSAR